MKILQLTLENFQGIPSAQFNFNGQDADIYGANGSGKTTVFNAVTWLLFDKPSTGAKNFSPKTKDYSGDDIHNLEHAVEAYIALDNGGTMRLKKILKEDWKKKRGSSAEEFAGHTVAYHIDGVPVKEKDYAVHVMLNIITGDRMQALMKPTCFAEEWDWGARRQVLLEICGDISDADVIASRKELKDLPKFLQVPGNGDKTYTVEEYMKIAKAQKTEINKQLAVIPAKIDEARRAMPDTSGMDIETVNERIASLYAEKQKLETDLVRTKDEDSQAALFRKKLSDAELELEHEKRKYLGSNNDLNDVYNTVIQTLKNELFDLENALKTHRVEYDRIVSKLRETKELRAKLNEQYKAIQAQQFRATDVCPTCGQDIPKEQIEEAKAKFNQSKSADIEKLRKKAEDTCSLKIIAELEAKLQKSEERIAQDRQLVDDKAKEIEAKEAQCVEVPAFEKTEAYTTLAAKIAQIKAESQQTPTGPTEQEQAIMGKLRGIQENIEACTQIKADIELAQKQQKRVDELSADEKTLTAEYERVELGVWLCEEFIRTKVSMLDERINSHFKTVKFRLFIQQVNGGLKEDCEVLIPTDTGLVPYAFANNAARINAGLEIIDALSKHWKVKMPVFVDNAESVTRLLDIDAQLIRLIVSEQDEKLRIETASKAA